MNDVHDEKSSTLFVVTLVSTYSPLWRKDRPWKRMKATPRRRFDL